MSYVKISSMSVTYIPERTKFILWGKAAGRCQYKGCSKQLYLDSLTKAEFNSAYIAHIIGDKPGGPRGHKKLSDKLKKDISNLMLMCDTHHRLIDKEQVDEHPVGVLRKMKREHEERMIRLTGIKKENEAHVILYGANIGSHSSPLTYSQAYQAITPTYYPTDQIIELGLNNSSFQDSEELYWDIEVKNLVSKYNQKVIPHKESSGIQNYCVFGIAPQPLLIMLGTLLFDLANVEVFSPQKEPKTWKWNKGLGEKNYFNITVPNNIGQKVALVFSLSANVNDDRITAVLGDDCSIWKVSIPEPNNDYMKFKNHLSQFRKVCRKLFNDIKSTHGEENHINIFPAMLPSTAIELGRVWNPKADLTMTIYDQNKKLGGFVKAIEIKND